MGQWVHVWEMWPLGGAWRMVGETSIQSRSTSARVRWLTMWQEIEDSSKLAEPQNGPGTGGWLLSLSLGKSLQVLATAWPPHTDSGIVEYSRAPVDSPLVQRLYKKPLLRNAVDLQSLSQVGDSTFLTSSQIPVPTDIDLPCKPDNLSSVSRTRSWKRELTSERCPLRLVTCTANTQNTSPLHTHSSNKFWKTWGWSRSYLTK